MTFHDRDYLGNDLVVTLEHAHDDRLPRHGVIARVMAADYASAAPTYPRSGSKSFVWPSVLGFTDPTARDGLAGPSLHTLT